MSTSTNYKWKAYGKMSSFVSYETFFVKLANPHQVRPRELRDMVDLGGESHASFRRCSLMQLSAWRSLSYGGKLDFSPICPGCLQGSWMAIIRWSQIHVATCSMTQHDTGVVEPFKASLHPVTLLQLYYSSASWILLHCPLKVQHLFVCIVCLYFVYSWLRRNYFSVPSICYHVLKLNDFSLFSPPSFLSKCFILLVSFSKFKKLIRADCKKLKQNRKICNENVKEGTWGLK